MSNGEAVEGLATRVRELEEENARLRIELWEWRDAAVGSDANQRSLEYLVTENQRLRYLIKRPWRVAEMASKRYAEKAKRRLVSARSANR